jgi:penicillin-insensitive murein endopeptidase
MKYFLVILFSAFFISATIYTVKIKNTEPGDPPVSNAQLIKEFYEKNKGDSLPSKIHGTEGAGTLDHAKLFPFSGTNFRYFDTASYLAGHAFMSDKMLQTLLASYQELETAVPGHLFTCMESGLQNGGHIDGHRTHQCGTSVDLMMPLMKDGQSYYKLDTIGGWHYSLEFDDRGRWTNDSTVVIDFNLLGTQILSLDKQARKLGWHVKKVILKLELKDEFYASLAGKKVRAKGIYLAMNLPPEVNKQHDDHFHVDFEPLPAK